MSESAGRQLAERAGRVDTASEPSASIPSVDVRRPDAAAVDEALQKAGFLLVMGHGVEPVLLAAMTAVSQDLLELCAVALGLPPDTLTALARHPTWTFNINRYPPLTEVGEPLPGQFRIGPHTDFGTVTVLDREPGAGGLQVDIDGLGWVDAPYDPDALTVNIGDLLAHWTGLRWRSGRHRVLPPQAGAPHEELVSLVFFFELDHDALVTPLAPPIGRRSDLPSVVSAPFLRARLDAISVGS